MDKKIVAFSKSQIWDIEDKIKNFLYNGVSKGEVREKIRLINVDTTDMNVEKVIVYLHQGNFISPTEDDRVKIISEDYYNYLKTKCNN